LCRRDNQGRLDAFEDLIREIKAAMYTLSDALALHYLSPVTTSFVRSS